MKTQLFSHYVAPSVWLLLKIYFKSQSKDIFVRINGILMISPLMVSSKNVKVSQERCLGTFMESFTASSLSEKIIVHKLLNVFSHYSDPSVLT